MFDENGNAKETSIVTVCGFDRESGEYQATYEVRVLIGTGIPGFSTLTPPPASKPGYACVWRGDEWEYVADFRGTTVYSVADGQAQNVSSLGAMKAGFVKVAPATPFDTWNGKKWVTDADAQKAAQVVQLEAVRTSLLSEADDIMRDWRDELSLGVISDDDKAKLLSWLDYKKRVKAVDISLGESIIWPEEPADVA
ncbi:tail fiber assembly protein [Erwinia sp. AnSW2-5]|uniref:tail fiber assembly protein n=1 Tax=Erwinia sp. AnSW2-5 TaxID=3367692 RepID=UPI00385B68EF